MTSNGPDERGDEQQRVVIRDKRRIDPATGAARTPTDQVWTPPGAARGGTGTAAVPPGAGDVGPKAAQPGGDAATWRADEAPEQMEDPRVADLTAQLSERTGDLQRITAEYANYRKRVERDRGMVSESATGAVLAALLPVLDDLDRARSHGDLTGAFKAVADQLGGVLTRLGLTTVGAPGDRFDPTLHEAVSHTTSPDVSQPTCVAVLRRGYAHRDRLLRPALVAVADPAEPDGAAAAAAAAGTTVTTSVTATASASATATASTEGGGPGGGHGASAGAGAGDGQRPADQGSAGPDAAGEQS